MDEKQFIENFLRENVHSRFLLRVDTPNEHLIVVVYDPEHYSINYLEFLEDALSFLFCIPNVSVCVCRQIAFKLSFHENHS